MELWDLYNEQRELTGRDHVRGEEVPQGFYHLVVHIWIRNSKGEYLINIDRYHNARRQYKNRSAYGRNLCRRRGLNVSKT